MRDEEAPFAAGDARAWLAARPPDLAWLDRPGWHQFRWRDFRGAWRTSERRVRDGHALVRALAAAPPRDAYVGTASWLDPVRLPRLAERDRPPPLLLDHLVVFDVDRAPFSLARLEDAREATTRLLAWIDRETTLDVRHVAFSGGKGFHVVARDPDRAPFEAADPRERETRVRAARRALLDRALAAGHDVDPTVTADTRRVIRLPGTLHGTTGWACAILPPGLVGRPLRDWLPAMPRHPRARAPPARAPSAPAKAPAAPAAAGRARALELQASSHVAGTRDRSALLAWLPREWGAGDAARARADARLRAAGLGPGLLWAHEGRLLVLVPRAVPRPALAAAATRARLAGFARALDARGHAWVAVAPRHAAGEAAPGAGFAPAGRVAGGACAHPWSRPHLDLARRLGHGLAGADGEAAGNARATLRLVEIA